MGCGTIRYLIMKCYDNDSLLLQFGVISFFRNHCWRVLRQLCIDMGLITPGLSHTFLVWVPGPLELGILSTFWGKLGKKINILYRMFFPFLEHYYYLYILVIERLKLLICKKRITTFIYIHFLLTKGHKMQYKMSKKNLEFFL